MPFDYKTLLNNIVVNDIVFVSNLPNGCKYIKLIEGTQMWLNSDNQHHRIEKDPLTHNFRCLPNCMCVTLPAIVWNDGGEEWWVNGKRHRTDRNEVSKQLLPACIYADGVHEWWWNGELHNSEKDIFTNLTLPAYVDYTHNEKRWYNHGVLHRTDKNPTDAQLPIEYQRTLPAITSKDTKEWWYEGKIHRTDLAYGLTLPAYISSKFGSFWYMNGLIHRDEKDPNDAHLPLEYQRTLPAVIQKGCKVWMQYGLYHNVDINPDDMYKPFQYQRTLPAVVKNSLESSDTKKMNKYWYKHGKLHNITKPQRGNKQGSLPAVIEFKNGHVIKEYWEQGCKIYDSIPLVSVAQLLDKIMTTFNETDREEKENKNEL